MQLVLHIWNLEQLILNVLVKLVFKGHLNIQKKVSLHDRCPFFNMGQMEDYSQKMSQYVHWKLVYSNKIFVKWL